MDNKLGTWVAKILAASKKPTVEAARDIQEIIREIQSASPVAAPGLREALEGATRVVVETDHTYREVGKIVAVDTQRVEFTPDEFRAALRAESVAAPPENNALIEQPTTYGGEMFNIGYRAALDDARHAPPALDAARFTRAILLTGFDLFHVPTKRWQSIDDFVSAVVAAYESGAATPASGEPAAPRQLICERNESSASAHAHDDSCYKQWIVE